MNSVVVLVEIVTNVQFKRPTRTYACPSTSSRASYIYLRRHRAALARTVLYGLVSCAARLRPFHPGPPAGRRLAPRDEADRTDRSPGSYRCCCCWWWRFTGPAERRRPTYRTSLYIDFSYRRTMSVSTVYRTRCSKSRSAFDTLP